MEFQIEPFVGAGALKFGMSPAQVRSICGDDYVSFKRVPTVAVPHDLFESLGLFVYYNKIGIVEALEFTKPAKPIYKQNNLIALSYAMFQTFLQKDDPILEIEEDSIISHRLGIGAWYPHGADEPGNPAETIIVFEKDYYGENSS